MQVNDRFTSFWFSLLRSVSKLRVLVFVACTLACISSGLSLLQPFLTSQILEQVTKGSPDGLPIESGVILMLALTAMFICNASKQFMVAYLNERIAFAKRGMLVSSLLSAQQRKLRSYDQGSIVNRISRDSETIAKIGVSAFVQLPADLLLVFGCTIGLLIIDWILFLAIALFVIVSLSLNTLSSKYIASLVKIRSRKLDELAEVAHGTMRASASIQNYRVEPEVISYFDALSAQVLVAGRKVARVASFLQPISGFLMQLGFLVVIALGGYRVAHNSLEMPSLIAFFLYLTYMLSPLSGISVFLNSLGDAWAASSRIDEILAIDDLSIADDRHISEKQSAIKRVPATSGDLLMEVRSVSFAYGNGPKVFSDLDFSLPSKGLTLLRGPSGSGKSTLISLLCGQETPNVGSIQVREDLIDSEGVWYGPNRLLVVPQEYVPWGQTVRDTLTFGRRGISDEMIIDLFRQLNLLGWFNALSDGLDTKQSALDEGASGGELKRLNILRAVLLEPRLLILDEPTANLDAANSQLVIALVSRLRRFMSILVVTHDSFDWSPDLTVTLGTNQD